MRAATSGKRRALRARAASRTMRILQLVEDLHGGGRVRMVRAGGTLSLLRPDADPSGPTQRDQAAQRDAEEQQPESTWVDGRNRHGLRHTRRQARVDVGRALREVLPDALVLRTGDHGVTGDRRGEAEEVVRSTLRGAQLAKGSQRTPVRANRKAEPARIAPPARRPGAPITAALPLRRALPVVDAGAITGSSDESRVPRDRNGRAEPSDSRSIGRYQLGLLYPAVAASNEHIGGASLRPAVDIGKRGPHQCRSTRQGHGVSELVVVCPIRCNQLRLLADAQANRLTKRHPCGLVRCRGDRGRRRRQSKS